MKKDGARAFSAGMKDPLGLAQGVSPNQAIESCLLVAMPPSLQSVPLSLWIWPLINGRAKSAFRDEVMGLDGFEWSASRIFLELVIPTDNPDFTFVFQSHLAGAKNVACRMKRNLYTMDVAFFPVRNAFNGFGFA